MWKTRWLTLCVLFSIVVTLAIAGPLIGYVKGFTSSSYVVDANRQRLVRDILERVRVGDALTETFSFKIEPAAMSECEYELFRQADQKRQIVDDIGRHISFSLKEMRSETFRSLMAESSLLYRFSWPKLGAIKGCLEASILAPICERHIRQLYWKIPERERKARDKRLRDLDSRYNDRLCEIAEYLKPRL